jgi:phosphoglycerate dehydrogenase-like enzyme
MAFSLILLSLKRYFQHAAQYTQPVGFKHLPVAGGYRSTLGIIGMGMIGRRLSQMLRTIDVEIIVYDPYVQIEQARQCGAVLVSLEEVFKRSDVISLHAANLPETQRMIKGKHFQEMKPGATFINTARGALVDETEMAAVLRERLDIWALLDVTYPEPPVFDSPLYVLPNVVLTPHIAGSMDNECRRMAEYMIDEYQRFRSGQPLLYRVTKDMLDYMA